MVNLNTASAVYAGSTLATAVYAGATLAWSGGSTDEFTPAADTYVNAGSAGSNYNTSSEIWIDDGTERIGYLEYDLSSLSGETLTAAELEVYVNSTSVYSLEVYYLPAAITFSTVTYTSRPSESGAVLLGTFADVSATGLVTSTLDETGIPVGGATTHLMIRMESGVSGDSMAVRSSDWAGYAGPKLTLSY